VDVIDRRFRHIVGVVAEFLAVKGQHDNIALHIVVFEALVPNRLAAVFLQHLAPEIVAVEVLCAEKVNHLIGQEHLNIHIRHQLVKNCGHFRRVLPVGIKTFQTHAAGLILNKQYRLAIDLDVQLMHRQGFDAGGIDKLKQIMCEAAADIIRAAVPFANRDALNGDQLSAHGVLLFSVNGKTYPAQPML